MDHCLPIQGYAVFDTGHIVSDSCKNMVSASSDGKLHILDADADTPSLRVEGRWIGFLELIREHPDYAKRVLAALLEPYRGAYETLRSNKKMPDTFEEFLSVLVSNANG